MYGSKRKQDDMCDRMRNEKPWTKSRLDGPSRREHMAIPDHWYTKELGCCNKWLQANICFKWNRCQAAVAEAFASGKLQLDILDKSAGIMKHEASYIDFALADCDASKRGMFMQFGRTVTGGKDFMNFKKTRDSYFLQVTGISSLDGTWWRRWG